LSASGKRPHGVASVFIFDFPEMGFSASFVELFRLPQVYSLVAGLSASCDGVRP
jgi:hypothetical protein